MKKYKRPTTEDVIVIKAESPLKPIKGDFKYFSFDQNNSGGHFVRNENVGDRVLIAARDYKDANRRAKQIGIYFDGCESGNDCDCCGDRWFARDSYDKGDEKPFVSGNEPAKWITEYHWTGRKVVIHHADGFMETHVVKGEENYEDR